MVETHNLAYQYEGSNPIAFPDINVESGKAMLICGDSGCGKTTLLHLLAGLRKPSKGQVIVNGKPLYDMSLAQIDRFRGKHIGIVYQQPYFIESMSIWDNLIISPFKKEKSKASAIANRLQISELLRRHPHQLSVGQQQRVTIARAVMNNPKLILVDEPTSALDNKNCSKVINLLQEEAASNEAALIIVTHDDRLRKEISHTIDLEPINT